MFSMRSVPTVTGESASTVWADVDLLKNCATSFTPLGVGPSQFCPFNQLLEADIVYVRDVVNVALLNPDQLAKIAMIADHCYRSADLAIHCMLELRRRSFLSGDAIERYIGQLNQKPLPGGRDEP